MGKLDGKVAVITAATSGMALAAAKLFVEEGAYVFITGRQQDKLDEAVESIGRDGTGVQGDAASLPDLDRLYETVKREKGRIDVLFASAGLGGPTLLGSTTEERFDAIFNLNTRGTFFTVQKALPLLRDGASILMNGSLASTIKGLPGRSVYAASKAALLPFARAWLVELQERNIRVNVLSPAPLTRLPCKAFLRRQGSTTGPACLAANSVVRKKLPRSPFSSPPVIPASSTAWKSSSTAAWRGSNAHRSRG